MREPASQLGVAFQSDKSLSEYSRLAALAEGYGFGTVSVYADLMFQPPLAALLAMAAATSRVRLGPACLNPFTVHPVEIAGQIAVLDAASHGRAYLGLSRGAWLESILAVPDRPLTAMREAVAVVRCLLSGGVKGFDGETFRLAKDQQLQYPVERREVPLLIGTWGTKMAALAGELASELKVGGSSNPAMVGVMRERLSVGLARAGRNQGEVGIVLGAVTVVDEAREAARQRARLEVARYLPVVARYDPSASIELPLLARIGAAVASDDLAGAAALVPDDMLDRFAFAGTPDDILVQTEAILAAGASRVEFGTPHGLTSTNGLKLLGEQVLPRIGLG